MSLDPRVYSSSAACTDQAECDRKAKQMLERIVKLTQTYQGKNPFWTQFERKAEAAQKGEGPAADPLYILHSNVFYLWELLEEACDGEGVKLLQQLERDCF